MSKSTTIEIKFLGNLTTFKEMFKGCNKLNQVTLNNIVTGNETETSSMFEGCTGLTEVKFENMTISNITSTSISTVLPWKKSTNTCARRVCPTTAVCNSTTAKLASLSTSLPPWVTSTC